MHCSQFVFVDMFGQERYSAAENSEVPVYKLVLLQVLAALSDVSSHIEKVHHAQTGRVLLIIQRQNMMFVAACVHEHNVIIMRRTFP